MLLTTLLTVGLPLLLVQINAQSDSKLNADRSATVVREEIFPIFLLDDDNDDDSDGGYSEESKQTESTQDSDRNIDIERALEKIKEAEEVLEQLEAQGSVNRPSFAKSINEKLSNNEDQDSSREFESTRQGKVNGVFTHPRLQSPSGKQQIDFDDSAPDSQQFDYPTKTQVPQKAFDEGPDRTALVQKPSLLLTLGGYQRPFESERKQSGGQLSPDANNDRSEERRDVNIVVPHVTYTDPLSSLMRIPGMGYQPPVVNSSPRTQTDNSQDVLSQFSAYSQNQQPANNLMSMQPNFQNAVGSNFPTPIEHSLYPPTNNNYFLTGNQPTQSDYFSVNNPFNTPSGIPYVSSGLETNPFQNVGYQTNNVASNLAPNSGVLPANYFDSSNVPGQLNSYQNFFPTHLYQQPRFPANTNILSVQPDSGLGQERKADTIEQELESVSREQHQDSPSGQTLTDNQQYMNVPLQNAGYGIVEPLPNQNQSAVQEVTRNGRMYPHHFISGNYPYNNPYQHDQRYFSFPPMRDNSNSAYGGPNRQRPTGADPNSSFITDEYFKHLRSPYPFPFSQTPYGSDNRFAHSNRQGETGNGIEPGFQNPLWNRRDPTINGTFQEGTSTGVRSVFNYLPRSDDAILRRFNPDVRPECANSTNITVCFQDVDYPREYVLRALDAEALMLRRLLPDMSFDDTDERQTVPSENDICQVDLRQGRPQRALDAEGKWKVIVNVGSGVTSRALSQNIRLEICRNHDQPCSHIDGATRTLCMQKYSVQRLMAWSPDRGIHMAMFTLPIACSCHIVTTQNPV